MIELFERARRKLRFLDLRWSGSAQVTIRVVECPGRWMPQADIEDLLSDMRSVVSRSLDQSLHYGVLSGDPERLRQAIVTILYDKKSGHPVAFNALSLMPLELRGQSLEAVHLGLVMVDPQYRTQGLSWVLYGLTCVLLFVRRGMRPLWLSNVTQVPSIVGKVAEAFPSAYPNPFAESRRSYDHLSIARQIMQRQRHVFGVGPEAEFDEQRFVITNAYTGGSDNLMKTWDQAPKHRDERANALCRTELDYNRGDDFLQIARLDLNSARRFLLEQVPRKSLPALVYRLLFLSLGYGVLPLLHWLTPSQAMGELRPRSPQHGKTK